jgi:hypothetical protein
MRRKKEMTRIANSWTNLEKTLTVTSWSAPAASSSFDGSWSTCSLALSVRSYSSSRSRNVSLSRSSSICPGRSSERLSTPSTTGGTKTIPMPNTTPRIPR